MHTIVLATKKGGSGDLLAHPLIVMRNDHQDSLASGLAVNEFAPNSKSTEEIRSLCNGSRPGSTSRRPMF